MTAKKITKKQINSKPKNSKKTLTDTIPLLISSTSATHSFLLHNDISLSPTQSLTLESHLSSTYHSLSKLFTLLNHNTTTLPPHPPQPPPALPHFLTHSSDQDPKWVPLFNLSKPSFTLLLRLLTPSLEKSNLFVPANVALGITLFRLSHAASFCSVGRRFGVEVNVACRVFYLTVKSIVENLGHLFELGSDLDRVIVGFGWISLPNCCGVLGIERFEVEGREDGVLVQALVDSEGRFLDVSAGWPGEMEPKNVLTSSKLYKGVENREYLSGDGFGLNEGSEIPQYVLGDVCYPLLSWLLTPFRDEEGIGECEVAFNEVHGRGMGLVETAFERVRSRWKIVGRKWKVGNLEAFPFVIVACCLLHNFMIKCSEEVTGESVGGWRENRFGMFDGEEDESGRVVRDELASHLCRVSQRS